MSNKERQRLFSLTNFITTFLTLLGLASLVDGIYSWSAFVSEFVETYQHVTYLLFSPFAIFFGVYVPNWVRDLLIVWMAFGSLGVRVLFHYMAETYPSDYRDRRPPRWYETRHLFIWPMGLFFLLMAVLDPRERRAGSISDPLKALIVWCAAALVPVIILVFADWQLLQRMSY